MRKRRPSSFSRLARGASMTEYALILVGVLLIGGGAFRLLGGKLKARIVGAGDVATTANGPGGGGDTAGSGAGGGSGGSGSGGSSGVATKAGSDEKSTATTKAKVGTNASDRSGSGGSNAGGGSGGNASENGNQASAAGDPDDLVENGFGLRRAFAIAMMILGIGSIGYFFVKGKKVVKDVKDAK